MLYGVQLFIPNFLLRTLRSLRLRHAKWLMSWVRLGYKFYPPPPFPTFVFSLFYFGSVFPHNLNLYIFIGNQTSTSKIIPSFLTAPCHAQLDALAHSLSGEILLVVSVTLLTFQAVIFHCPNEISANECNAHCAPQAMCIKHSAHWELTIIWHYNWQYLAPSMKIIRK